MRALVVAWATCLSMLSVGMATEALAAVRKPTRIEPQGLAAALQRLAREREFQIVFRPDVVKDLRTSGAVGELTADEALTQLLAGTDLTFRYLNDHTITIEPVAPASAPPASVTPPEARSGSDRGFLRLAQGVAVSPASTASSSQDESSGDGSVLLEEVVVTGSHLRGSESRGATNLRIATSVEIEESGATSIPGFLKKIPEVGAEGFGENRVNTSSPGTAAVSLRGLGANSTLVLLNGRRVTPAPFAQGGSAAALGTIQFVDLNMIPVDAVSRVEVLKDGASAIYGADAVAGVVNFILKDRADGFTVRTYAGDFPGDISASTYKTSVFGGTTFGNLRLFALGNYMHQDRIQYGQLSPKQVALSNGSNPGTFIVPEGARNPITGEIIPAGTPAANRTFTVDASATADSLVFNTMPASATQNRYNINAELMPQPRVTRAGALATATYEFSSSLEAYAELNYQRNTNDEFLSASPITNLNTVILPADAVYNPFGVTITNSPTAGANLVYRFTEAGPRITETTNEFSRVVAGMRGDFARTWSWDASFLFNHSTSHNDLEGGWLSQAAVNAALADPNPATALNLFTNGNIRNSPETIDRLRSNATRDAFTDLMSFGVKATGDAFDLPTGTARLAVGAEWREERFRDKRSDDQLLNQSTPVAESRGSRRAEAIYAELQVPLASPANGIPGVHALDVNLSGRAEHYSDAGFDYAAVPKVGLRWQPLGEQITLRASWGKGFRAPSLAELYQPQATSIAFNLPDPLRVGRPGSNANDGATGQRQVVSGGNPELDPEKSESWNYGVLFRPAFAEGLSLSLDYYRIDVDDRIGAPAPASVILANPDLFPGFVERAAPTASDIANGLPGEVIRIRTVLGNFGKASTDGVDLAAEYRFGTASLGEFTVRASGSRVLHSRLQSRRDLPTVDTAGTYEVPRTRGSGSVSWSRGNWGAAVTADYISSFDDLAPSTRRVSSQTITGLQASYSLPYMTKVTLGVNNLFDEKPPLTSGSTGYAERTSYYLPRFIYLDATWKF
jgi:iron complex outermembrane receptor protein